MNYSFHLDAAGGGGVLLLVFSMFGYLALCNIILVYSRHYGCCKLDLFCHLLDSLQLSYTPVPSPQLSTRLCPVSLPGGFLRTREACSARVQGSWELQWAREELESMHRHPSFPVPQCSKFPEKLDANSLLRHTVLLAAFLLTHSTSWGHSYPRKRLLVPTFFPQGQLLEQLKLRQGMSRKS